MIDITPMVKQLRDDGILEPAAIANRILAITPVEQYGDLLSTVLGEYVRKIICNMRNDAKRSFPLPERKDEPLPVRNPKAISARRMRQRELYDQTVNLNGRTVRIGDCFRSDLLAYAQSLRNQASAMVNNAEYFERLASFLPDDTTSVRDAHLNL